MKKKLDSLIRDLPETVSPPSADNVPSPGKNFSLCIFYNTINDDLQYIFVRIWGRKITEKVIDPSVSDVKSYIKKISLIEREHSSHVMSMLKTIYDLLSLSNKKARPCFY